MYKRRSKGKEGVGKREQVVRGEKDKEEKRREKEGQGLKKEGKLLYSQTSPVLFSLSANQLEGLNSVFVSHKNSNRMNKRMPLPLHIRHTHPSLLFFSFSNKVRHTRLNHLPRLNTDGHSNSKKTFFFSFTLFHLNKGTDTIQLTTTGILLVVRV